MSKEMAEIYGRAMLPDIENKNQLALMRVMGNINELTSAVRSLRAEATLGSGYGLLVPIDVWNVQSWSIPRSSGGT